MGKSACWTSCNVAVLEGLPQGMFGSKGSDATLRGLAIANLFWRLSCPVVERAEKRARLFEANQK